MPRSIHVFLVLMAAAVMLIGLHDARADAARGRTLSERWCSQCHGVVPHQTSADPKAPTFSTIAGEPSITETSLHVFLRTPHFTMPNVMLNSDDMDDIIEYLLSLKPRR